MKRLAIVLLLGLALALGACASPKITLFDNYTEPLKEYTLQGEGEGKVLLLPVRGLITDSPREGLLRSKPSVVQEVTAHLKKAAEDPEIKAVVVMIDSPGGTSVASDILYHEISAYREKSGAAVLTCMMGLAASGGYYTAVAADRIMAHPSTVTGSVGTIFLQPQVMGLMQMIGVDVETYKSGKNKDMGTLFRAPTDEEKEIFSSIISDLNKRFIDVVRERRHLDDATMAEVATARVYSADEAKAKGLIDSIGYVDDALDQAKEMAGLAKDAKVIVYRRSEYADDNAYNPFTGEYGGGRASLIDLGALNALTIPESGFYHLWAPQYAAR